MDKAARYKRRCSCGLCEGENILILRSRAFPLVPQFLWILHKSLYTVKAFFKRLQATSRRGASHRCGARRVFYEAMPPVPRAQAVRIQEPAAQRQDSQAEEDRLRVGGSRHDPQSPRARTLSFVAGDFNAAD